MNTNSYIEGILTPALVEMKNHFRDEVLTFQQDGAPLHPKVLEKEIMASIVTRFEPS